MSLFPMPVRNPKALDLIGAQVTRFLQDLCSQIRREVRLECATKVAHVTADWASGHASTCPDCQRTCQEMGEDMRKAVLEEGE